MKEKALPDPLFLWPDEAVPQRKFRSKIERVIPDKAPITLITGVNYPCLIPYPAKKAASPSPAVIVCPGGAYDVLALDYEGLEIAEYLSKHGVSAFVLKYRVPRQREAALCDATRAVRYLRYYAKKFGIRKDAVGIMGFSAGGHLSAFTAGNGSKKLYALTDEIDSESARPDNLGLIYPAYLELKPKFRLLKDHPPTFLLQASDDPYFPSLTAYEKDFSLRSFPWSATSIRKAGTASDRAPAAKRPTTGLNFIYPG